MHRIATALLTLLASCSALAPVTQNATKMRENRVSLYLGQRNFGADEWEPVDEQATFGVEYSQERAGNPIGFEVGLMGSADEGGDDVFGTDVQGSTREIYGGVRKTFGSDVVRPYVGGGLSYIQAEGDIDGIGDDDDSSIAAYVHGGVGFQLSEMFTLGLDLRFLFGSDIDVFEGVPIETPDDADYGQLSVFVAFGF